jgi:hypothetical protein
MAQKDPPQGVSGGSFPVSAHCFESVSQEFGQSGHQDWAAEQFDEHQYEGCKHCFSFRWCIFKPIDTSKIQHRFGC